ncbi:hypothetical protein HRbin21_00786 [bacterium HR21]|nr:hypothetical protein HRbin21_00786 [bacterium HR21]
MREVTAVACAFLLGACVQSTQPEYTAERLTLEQLRTTPGFAWFDAEFRAYQPDTALVAQIRSAYVPGQHHFYVYVKPTCSCVGTQKLFPHFLRILAEAGVREEDCEIYAMHGTGDKHPHQNRFRIERLPSFYITSGADIRGSILGELPPDKTLEQIIVEALRP